MMTYTDLLVTRHNCRRGRQGRNQTFILGVFTRRPVPSVLPLFSSLLPFPSLSPPRSDPSNPAMKFGGALLAPQRRSVIMGINDNWYNHLCRRKEKPNSQINFVDRSQRANHYARPPDHIFIDLLAFAATSHKYTKMRLRPSPAANALLEGGG